MVWFSSSGYQRSIDKDLPHFVCFHQLHLSRVLSGCPKPQGARIWSADPSEKPSALLRKRQNNGSPKKIAIGQWSCLVSRKMGLSHSMLLSHRIRAFGIIILIFQSQVPGYDQTHKLELLIGGA
jgi:hypothetical protein